jgi:hypothetical protein
MPGSFQSRYIPRCFCSVPKPYPRSSNVTAAVPEDREFLWTAAAWHNGNRTGNRSPGPQQTARCRGATDCTGATACTDATTRADATACTNATACTDATTRADTTAAPARVARGGPTVVWAWVIFAGYAGDSCRRCSRRSVQPQGVRRVPT